MSEKALDAIALRKKRQQAWINRTSSHPTTFGVTARQSRGSASHVPSPSRDEIDGAEIVDLIQVPDEEFLPPMFYSFQPTQRIDSQQLGTTQPRVVTPTRHDHHHSAAASVSNRLPSTLQTVDAFLFGRPMVNSEPANPTSTRPGSSAGKPAGLRAEQEAYLDQRVATKRAEAVTTPSRRPQTPLWEGSRSHLVIKQAPAVAKPSGTPSIASSSLLYRDLTHVKRYEPPVRVLAKEWHEKELRSAPDQGSARALRERQWDNSIDLKALIIARGSSWKNRKKAVEPVVQSSRSRLG